MTAFRNNPFPPSSRSRWPRWIHPLMLGTIPPGTVILAMALLLAGCSAGDDPSPPNGAGDSTRVTAITVSHSSHPERFRVSGRVTASDKATLSFKGGGVIETLAVEEGDRFRRGDLLAALDTTELAAAMTNAVELRRQAERDVARLERLREDEVIAEQQLENARTGLARAEAAERQARFVLRHARIVAPFAGVVTHRLAEEGELVGEGSPILRVASDQQGREVSVGVPARFLPALAVGDTATVHVETVDRPLTATLTRIGAAAEPGTGNIRVELSLPPADGLYEGLVADVVLNGPARPAISLPAAAVVGGDADLARVYVIEDGVALRRELRLLGFAGDSVLVAPDLPEHARVAVDGAGFLQDGDLVRIGERPR